MTDAPEKIWINKSFGKHPEDWDFSIGMWETKKHLREKIEYTRSDVAQAMVAAALDEWIAVRSDSHGVSGYHLNGDIAGWDEFDLAEAPSDARAALDAMLAKAREDALREAAHIADGYGSCACDEDMRDAILALIDRTAEGEA